jgi:hypothetical protein
VTANHVLDGLKILDWPDNAEVQTTMQAHLNGRLSCSHFEDSSECYSTAFRKIQTAKKHANAAAKASILSGVSFAASTLAGAQPMPQSPLDPSFSANASEQGDDAFEDGEEEELDEDEDFDLLEAEEPEVEDTGLLDDRHPAAQGVRDIEDM